MWIADGWKDYELLDCGGGEKLERWDKQILVRPDPQAIWETDHSPKRSKVYFPLPYTLKRKVSKESFCPIRMQTKLPLFRILKFTVFII